jgi:O-antigen/teichoic acid export membrane protein
MTTDVYIPMLVGAVSMASFVAGLLFLRYWRRSRDRLFLYFCIAFFVDALVRVGQSLFTVADENEAFIYVPRLATFALIAWAIVDKNRRTGGS